MLPCMVRLHSLLQQQLVLEFVRAIVQFQCFGCQEVLEFESFLLRALFHLGREQIQKEVAPVPRIQTMRRIP